MKNILLLAVVALACLVQTACEKDTDIPPVIVFKTGGNYVSADGTVPQNASITVGIYAEKTTDKDVLKQLNHSVSFDGGPSMTVTNEAIPSNQEDIFEKDYTITTRNQAGAEKHTFTVTTADGLVNQAILTLTVQ